MNIFDFIMNSSPEQIKALFAEKCPDFTSQRDFPDADHFIKFFGLEKDERVDLYSFQRHVNSPRIIRCTINFTIPELDDYTDGFQIYFSYYINGKKTKTGRDNLKVTYMGFGYEYSTDQIYIPFNYVISPLIKNPDSYDFVSYNILAKNFDIDNLDNNVPFSVYYDKIIKGITDMTPYFLKLINTYKDKTIIDMYKKAYITKVHYNALNREGFRQLFNIIYLGKIKFNTDVSVEDAILMKAAYEREHNRHLSGDNLPKKHASDFMNIIYAWNGEYLYGAENDRTIDDITTEEFVSFLESCRSDISDEISNYKAYQKAFVSAETYVFDALRKAFDEAEQKFGIKKDFLTLSGFYNSKGGEFMDKNSPTPKNWRYNTKES
jgi:hypothetical protein